MAATAETDSVHDHMTRLRMKMVQQKIQNEKDRIVNRPPSEESTNNDLENQARLQQAMLRRQELLDKIRREQLLNEESKRPRTYSARRRYTPSPLPAPPSRRSLPDFARYNMYNYAPDTYRSKPEMSQVKHVIEHRIATPKPQYNLPPINQQQQLQPRPPVIVQPAPPQVIPMQQPTPQIIQGPAPQHIITGYPSPVIHNLGPQPPENKSMFNKADFGEMMMMQNAQMHQMVMQKLMLGNLGNQGGCHDCHSGCCSSHGVHGHGCGHGCSHGTVCYDCHAVPRANGSVHHHHYTSPPPSQPAIHHYTSLPAMDIRGYPLRGELYGGYYADPYSYTYEYYQ